MQKRRSLLGHGIFQTTTRTLGLFERLPSIDTTNRPTTSRTDQRDQPGLNCFTTRYFVVTTRHVYFYTPGNPEDHGKLPMGFAFLSQNLFSSCPDWVLFLNITTVQSTYQVMTAPPECRQGVERRDRHLTPTVFPKQNGRKLPLGKWIQMPLICYRPRDPR